MQLPHQLLDSLEGIKGFDRQSFSNVHTSGEQVCSVRFNPLKKGATDAKWQLSEIPWCPKGYYLSTRPSFTLDPSFHGGAYYVQEASSMFLWHALAEIVGEGGSRKVLDLCAAPGGKTTLLASFFADGLVVGNEVIKSRAAVLVENITKWGADNVIITNNDPAHFRAVPGYFDLMVIDAPCSGSGLFRKDPEAIKEWSTDAVELCSQRQQRILADVLPALREDGILLYSTCSYSPQEDEFIADWLVEEMDMQSLSIPLHPDWQIIETRSPGKQASGYRFYPDKIKGEGFFLAAFQKKGNTSSVRQKRQTLVQPSPKELALVADFMALPDSGYFFKQAETIRIIPAKWANELQILAGCLYIKKAGVGIGTVKGKDLIPSHELAVGPFLLDGLPSVEVTKEQALQFLRRKELALDAQNGWVLVQYGGLSLGWVKVLPNRINNYYPSEWRIVNV